MDPIVQLEHEWPALASGTLRSRLRAWQADEPALARFSSPQLLVRFLQQYGADLDAKDAALAALLRRVHDDRAAGRLVLQALLPGLKRLAVRLVRDPAERDECWAALLAAAWQQIVSYPLARRPKRVAANLLLDTLLTVRRERTQEAKQREPLCEAPPPSTGSVNIEQPLRSAVGAGAITEAEAALIAETRIDGASLSALAEKRGLSYIALLMRRWRAERRLLLFLGKPRVRTGPRNRRSFSARVTGSGARAVPTEEPSFDKSEGGEGPATRAGTRATS